MSDDRIKIAIYKIDKEGLLFKPEDDLISILADKISKKGFASQNLGKDVMGDYKILLFYKKSHSKPRWKIFLSGIVKPGEDILKDEQGWNESFVMLCLNTKSNNLYAIASGSGYFAVQDFIDNNFGVDILSRIIKKEDKILKSVREKSVIGGILGSTKYFRKNYNLFENDSFGKIYQELKAVLDKNILMTEFGFSEDELKKDSMCIAKTSFCINKSITINEIFNILNGCESVSKRDAIPINSVEKIGKKETALTKKLYEELITQLWNRYEGNGFMFDLCPENFEKYLTAQCYVVKKGISDNNYFKDIIFDRLENIDLLFEQVRKHKNAPQNKDDFEKLMKSLRIYSYDGEDMENELTGGSVIGHIFGDVQLSGVNYFLIDNAWYRIKDDFIKGLNGYCDNFINNNFIDGLDKKWDYKGKIEDEDGYNGSYVGDNNTIVLHKITHENIELCDILKWDDNNVYFYFIKAGFGNTMRDLCSQVLISANRLERDINSSKEYIEGIYDRITNKLTSEDGYFSLVGKQIENKKISKEDFVKIFTKKRFFIISVLDISESERKLKDGFTNFRSNIAKFSFQELSRSMKGIDENLKVTQIFKF